MFAAPTDLVVVATTASSISLSWTAPPNTNFANCSYVLTWQSATGSSSQSVGASQTTSSVTGLASCVSYSFSLCLQCSGNNGSSVTTTGTTGAGTYMCMRHAACSCHYLAHVPCAN